MIYPAQIKCVLAYIEAMDEASKKIEEQGLDYAIWPTRIELRGPDDENWGYLSDEVGGAYSWTIPGAFRASNTDTRDKAQE